MAEIYVYRNKGGAHFLRRSVDDSAPNKPGGAMAEVKKGEIFVSDKPNLVEKSAGKFELLPPGMAGAAVYDFRNDQDNSASAESDGPSGEGLPRPAKSADKRAAVTPTKNAKLVKKAAQEVDPDEPDPEEEVEPTAEDEEETEGEAEAGEEDQEEAEAEPAEEDVTDDFPGASDAGLKVLKVEGGYDVYDNSKGKKYTKTPAATKKAAATYVKAVIKQS